MSRFFSARCLQLGLALSVLVLAGCQQRISGSLAGQWVGLPDTAEQRAIREAEKYGDDPNAAESNDNSITDWEKYGREVTFNFAGNSHLEMTLAGNSTVVGSWTIVETSPTGCVIEVETPTGADEAREIRRYRLETDYRDGELVGFLLQEEGADRRLGALYFRRP